MTSGLPELLTGPDPLVDDIEARRILEEQLAPWRRLTYAELAAQIDVDHHLNVVGAGGTEYQVEIQVFWEVKPGSVIHVLGSIDDGSFWRACSPLTDSFVVHPGPSP